MPPTIHSASILPATSSSEAMTLLTSLALPLLLLPPLHQSAHLLLPPSAPHSPPSLPSLLSTIPLPSSPRPAPPRSIPSTRHLQSPHAPLPRPLPLKDFGTSTTASRNTTDRSTTQPTTLAAETRRLVGPRMLCVNQRKGGGGGIRAMHDTDSLPHHITTREHERGREERIRLRQDDRTASSMPLATLLNFAPPPAEPACLPPSLPPCTPVLSCRLYRPPRPLPFPSLPFPSLTFAPGPALPCPPLPTTTTTKASQGRRRVDRPTRLDYGDRQTDRLKTPPRTNELPTPTNHNRATSLPWPSTALDPIHGPFLT